MSNYRKGDGKGDHVYSDMGNRFNGLFKRFPPRRTAPADCEKLKRRADGSVQGSGRPPASHCKRGHPLTEANTYLKRSKYNPGGITRECKVCERARGQRQRRKAKEATV